MTESEWLANPSTDGMMYHLETTSSERKLRLFVHACCCRLEHELIEEGSRTALTGLELYIEDRVERGDLTRLHSLAQKVLAVIEAPLRSDGFINSTPESHAACAVVFATNPNFSTIADAASVARDAVSMRVRHRTTSEAESVAAYFAEVAIQSQLIRDIFGNPFRPVVLDPAWLTSDVLALARGIYEERAFDRMPILADALQDAGCTNDDILNHCRDANQVHVRGCWVVDLLLGKE